MSTAPANSSADLIHGGTTDTKYQTPQRRLMEQAFNRALQAGKRLVVRIEAPWSDECVTYEESLPQHGARLNELLSKVESLVLNEADFDRAHGVDYLPSEMLHFQTVYFCDPATRTWAIVPHVTSAQLFTQYLTLWLERPQFPQTLQQLALEATTPETAVGIPFKHLVETAIQTAGYSLSFEETRALVEKLREKKAKQPDLFQGIDLDALYMRGSQNQISAGRITYEELSAKDPQLGKRMFDSLENMIEARLYNVIGVLLRKQGLEAAARQVPALLETVHKDMAAKGLTHEGEVADTGIVRAKNEAAFKVLEARAGLITREQAVKFNEQLIAQNVPFYFRESVPHIFVALGDYATAASLIEATLPEWGMFYDGLIAHMRSQTKSKDSKDEKMVQMFGNKLAIFEKLKVRVINARRARAESLRKLASS
ncbi:hypothetical protein [Hyalangium minutum]|uniref:hypothetical protein n=1 Tax=Hyalangium minutum TaxID=394096 RepID=UPI0012FB7E32|nr:hypothetical protein [Hyalangium minutum]